MSFGRSKKIIFSIVIDRVWKKLKGLKEKCLFRVGKETLIKSIAQAISNYIMSCYKFPEACGKEIETMLSKFREFSGFNKALMGKHCWQLISKEGSLMEQIFKSIYYPSSNFMEANIGFKPNYAWRSIIRAREVMESGGRWLIGDAKKVKI